ncbi:MAG: DUF2271 domain-containing protein [Gemmatimonadaceae bacterium]
MKHVTGIVVAFSLAASQIAAANHNRPVPLQVVSYHHDDILGTSADFKFVTASPNSAASAERVALAEIERLRRVLSSWDSNSEIAQLFAQGHLEHPSPELVAVLNQYIQWNERSGRAYSARVGEVSALWKQGAAKGMVPAANELASVVAEIATPAWRIDAASNRITALTTQRVDLNSLGKGFIIDHALQAVRDSVKDVKGALINIGGDVQVWGSPPAGETWHVGVANPLNHADNAKPLVQLALRGGSVSSSGDYERGYTIGMKHYSHIIDPRTGQPANGIVGVTVIASNNATANALATTLSVLSPDSGLALVRTVPGAEALIVSANGKSVQTPGFAAYVELSSTNSNASAKTSVKATLAAKFAIDVNPTERNRHAPFVALWITDTAGKHVRTVAFWGDTPKYLHEMSKWWGLNHADKQLIDAVTRASRPAGKYTLEWDGLDQKGAAVAAGPYLFWLEVAFEDGAHSAKSLMLTCGAAETAGTIPQAAAFTGAEISCGSAK